MLNNNTILAGVELMIEFNKQILRLLPYLILVSLIISLGAIFIYTPPMYDGAGTLLNESFNIFFIHLPIALISYFAFMLVFVSSILYLHTFNNKWDKFAASSAEIGAIFAFLVLLTGSIWANDVWGWYWVWEPRLTTSLVLFLVYVGYIMVRQSVDEPEKGARLSAIFGIVGFISVPLSFFSIRLWRSVHPVMFGDTFYGTTGGGIGGIEIIVTLFINLIAFFLLFVGLLIFRYDNEKLKSKVYTLKRKLMNN